jgi:hypothetical protein
MSVIRVNSPPGTAGRLFGSLFLGVFLLFGLGFTGMAGRSYWAAAQTRAWIPVECTIVSSQVIPSANAEKSADLSVRYRYSFKEHEYFSTRLSRGMSSSRDAADIYRLSQQLAPGTRTNCFVDPEHPEEAVLFRGELVSGIVLLFPLAFVAIGGGGLFSMWRSRRNAPDALSTKAISVKPAASGKGRLIAGFICGMFLLFGLVLGYIFAGKPLLLILSARSWETVPCTIVSSRLVSHSSGDGTTYSVEVVFRYTVDGDNYTAARYKFAGGSTSGAESKREAVRQLPPGKKTVCYINPHDPTDAVLIRGLTPDLWFGLIPLLFILIGVVGLWFTVFRIGRADVVVTSAPLRNPVVTSPRAATPVTGSAELQPAQTRTVKLIGFSVMAVFWNGIISVFLYNLIADARRDRVSWFLVLFLIPFVAIGIFLIGAAVRQALALSNPRPRLTVNPSAVPPGKKFAIAWELDGKVQAVRRLRIVLEGREEAKYRRGTNTATDRHVFATIPIVDTADFDVIRRGTAELTVPADTMHSWTSANNSIVWILRVRGEIPRWPDIDDEFPFTVLPHSASA